MLPVVPPGGSTGGDYVRLLSPEKSASEFEKLSGSKGLGSFVGITPTPFFTSNDIYCYARGQTVLSPPLNATRAYTPPL
jgi:hypothetical protein